MGLDEAGQEEQGSSRAWLASLGLMTGKKGSRLPAQPLIKQARVAGDFFDEESAGGVEQGVAAPGDIGCFEPLGGTSATIRLAWPGP